MRVRLVSLETWALSAMATLTVRMSPTLRALWSWKNCRAPVRHSELGEAGVVSGSGESSFWSVGHQGGGEVHRRLLGRAEGLLDVAASRRSR